MDTSWLLIWMSRTFRYFLDLYIPFLKKGFWVVHVLMVFIRTYSIAQDFGVYNTKGITLSQGIESLICNILTRCPVLVP